jgi:hypothetical protein
MENPNEKPKEIHPEVKKVDLPKNEEKKADKNYIKYNPSQKTTKPPVNQQPEVPTLAIKEPE